jgi:hypothetical protein
MARAGVPVGTVQEWMGHADPATTQIYMHYAQRATDAALIDSAFGPSLATNLRVAWVTDANSANREARRHWAHA